MNDEKVLDVPAFDMTDAALNPVQSASDKKRTKKTKHASRRGGSMGRATFEAINKMTADGKLTKQAAFSAYGERTKTKPGTVSANYYRVARAEAPPRQPNDDAARRRPLRRPQHPGDSSGVRDLIRPALTWMQSYSLSL